MELIKTWLTTNLDFLIVGVGVTAIVVGMLVEFSKKAWKPLEKKFAEEDETLAKIGAVKAWVCQILGAMLVIVFLDCVAEGIVIPGGKVCLPIWFFADFLLQYVVSCYGLKFFQKAIAKGKNRPPKEKKAKPTVVKCVKDPVTGELVEVAK